MKNIPVAVVAALLMVWASLPAFASVVVETGEVSPRSLSAELCPGAHLLAGVDDSVASRTDAQLSLVIDLPLNIGAAANDGLPPIEPMVLSEHAQGGMSPLSSSLTQVHGSGTGGAALASNLAVAPCDALRAALLPTAITAVPSEPVFRWFRPPRV